MCQLCIIRLIGGGPSTKGESERRASTRNHRGNVLDPLVFRADQVTIVGAWLIIHRYRVIRLEEIRDEENLKMLISSRHQEKPTDSTAAGEVS